LKQSIKWALASLLLAGALLTLFFSTRPKLLEQENFLMGTFIRLSAYGDSRTKTRLNESMEIIARLDATLSLTRPDSEIARLNAQAGKKAVPVSPETLELLQIAIQWAKATHGAFDPTVAPIVQLWGIGGEHPRIPTDKELKKASGLVDYRDIEISGDTVF
jgi:thiamine biosynthesis lipoprotein